MNHDEHVPDAVNELADLQLQHPTANNVLALGADHPYVPGHHQIIEEEPIQLPALHLFSYMENRCPHCGARYSHHECSMKQIFTKCCFQGKVTLLAIKPPSQNILELFTGNTEDSQHCLGEIRHRNAAMLMASWNAILTEYVGRGPRVVTIHGQAYQLTAAQAAPKGQPPQYAQLYMLESTNAWQQRVTHPRNANLRPEILQVLQNELMDVNPYARQYKNMGQILKRERQLTAANNQPVWPNRMVIATHSFQIGCYNNT